MKVSVKVVLTLTLMATLGGWMFTLNTWYDAVSVHAVAGLLTLLASHLGAAFGVRIPPKE